MPTIAVTRELRAGETRVALTPDAAKKLIGAGFAVVVEAGAGAGSQFNDALYEAAGCRVVADGFDAIREADILLKVREPSTAKIAALKPGAIVVALLNPHQFRDTVKALADAGATAFAMEFVPRITRAQAMDVLSSQANLAGYRSVVEAAQVYGRAMPMMMTPAGTIAPAKVFIMGAGVAGLQAIATARRLGVRPAAKEQVESLGAKFIAVEDEEFKAAETAGGYAKEMSAEYRAKQAALISEHIKKQDIVITTALIPGRPAPRLVTAEQVASMRDGSVIIDLAVEQGGNVEGVVADAVTDLNMPGRIAGDASALYARNLAAFVELLITKEGALVDNFEDEILAASLVTHKGAVVHPALQ
jgi:H+-translocating NAD(P) transhydrogenase subunit alpha